MSITILIPVLECILFGLIVGGGFILIGTAPMWRQWLAYAWVLAWLCWIVLFGLAHV